MYNLSDSWCFPCLLINMVCWWNWCSVDRKWKLWVLYFSKGVEQLKKKKTCLRENKSCPRTRKHDIVIWGTIAQHKQQWESGRWMTWSLQKKKKDRLRRDKILIFRWVRLKVMILAAYSEFLFLHGRDNGAMSCIAWKGCRISSLQGFKCRPGEYLSGFT